MNFPSLISLIPLIISLGCVAFLDGKQRVQQVILLGAIGSLCIQSVNILAAYFGVVNNESVLMPILALMSVISFILILIFTPYWSSDSSTLFGCVLIFISAFLILLSDNIFQMCPFMVLAWSGALIAAKGHGNMLKLFLIYGVLIGGLLGLSHIFPAFHSFSLMAMMLLFGVFPLSAWYGFLFQNMSTVLSTSIFVFQLTVAVKINIVLPELTQSLHIWLPIAAIASAMVGVFQRKAMRVFAGLASSQILFVAFCFTFYDDSLQSAAVLIALALMLATSGLILMVGAMEARHGQLKLNYPSGNYESYPRLANLMLLFGLVSSGFPLTLGYVGEDLLFEIDFHNEPLVIFGWLIVMALNAISALRFFLFLCQGRDNVEQGIDLKPSKYVAGCFSVALLFLSAFLIN